LEPLLENKTEQAINSSGIVLQTKLNMMSHQWE